MNLPAFCIKRPAFTIVISLIMVVIGCIGFMNLPVRWIPNVAPPSVTVETIYPGASARLIEHDVTKVIEGALSGINGIETISSTSRRESSQVNIEFKLGRNMDTAVADVRTAIERVRDELPSDVQNPMIMKADPNNNPIIYISFYDPRRDARQLSDYVDKYILPAFETTDGVGSVVIYGKRVTAMQVKLDPAKMAGANVTVDEVAQLLRQQSTSIPGGQIRGADRFYSVIMNAAANTEKEFNDLIVRDNQNQVVRLRDIGEAKYDAEESDTTFRVSGQPGIALGIIPQSSANPLDVERQVQQVFASIKRNLPAGFEAKIIYNQTDYIRASIHSVYESFLEAVVFVWLIIYVFLCRFRATIIPVITIPVCLISVFAILYFLGFTINTITLMALVLAIGLVVDDAIVMLENISRHIEEGMLVYQAALRGSREMIVPVIAMTLTLAAVFAPIAFTPGLLGVLFREFTFTLAGAVLISGFVALTLTPMMCARILRQEQRASRYEAWFVSQMTRCQEIYQSILYRALKYRLRVMLGLIGVAMMGGILYHFVPAELAPAEDMNEIDVHVSAPRSASYAYTNQFVQQLETIYSRVPEIESYLTIGYAAPHSFHVLMLKPKKYRSRSTEAIVEDLNAKAAGMTGVRVNVFAPPPPLAEFAGGDDGDSLGLTIMTSSDYQRLQASSQLLMTELKRVPGFTHVENSLKWDNEQFQVTIDRERAADLRVDISAITNTISTLIAGRKIGKVEDANIFVKVREPSLADPAIFDQLYVRNQLGSMIALSGLLKVRAITSPEVFRHADRLRADSIYLSLAPDFKLADAIKTLQKIAKETLPDDMKYAFSGEAKSFLDSNGKTFLTFLLAILFIYLVLVAQFESFIDPFIIMLTVPFAVSGALLTLKLFGGSVNIYSNIGMVTLIGLITKHGILITEFANRQRAVGKSIQEAVVSACLLRLRPILMTTAAMVLGALPLAFAMGAGAESRQQVGLVIAGGLLFGTIFSLIVVPVMYTYLAPFRYITLDQEDNYAAAL